MRPGGGTLKGKSVHGSRFVTERLTWTIVKSLQRRLACGPRTFMLAELSSKRAISVTVHFPSIHNGQDVHEIVLHRFASVFRDFKVENEGNTVGTERLRSMGTAIDSPTPAVASTPIEQRPVTPAPFYCSTGRHTTSCPPAARCASALAPSSESDLPFATHSCVS
jgi:hypothetical protein